MSAFPSRDSGDDAPINIFAKANVLPLHIFVKAYIQGMARASFDLAELFAALSDPTRLRLLNLMRDREVCVCDFVEILGQSQPKISRHLAYLRRAGIVCARREGKWMHYRIERPADAGAAAILETTLQQLDAKREMRSDRAKLGRMSCAPGSALITLKTQRA
ncbi:Arsenical resistance operon repressor [Acidobacterium capsulatum ATCC 51196]|uniref:Arsenical resistance operon repressor n=2 Tax=Acidobacteriaceae TaxID=204434 RepID=C1F6X2_ACIC5|nr:Arsenical resistance operon repressor [Acidobacterium capsulatum ATCC 51196]